MTIFTLTSVGVPIAFGSTQYFTAIQNGGQVKSFVDDLVMKLGTVSMRVALVLRSAEVQPVFQDLCIWFHQVSILPLFEALSTRRCLTVDHLWSTDSLFIGLYPNPTTIVPNLPVKGLGDIQLRA